MIPVWLHSPDSNVQADRMTIFCVFYFEASSLRIAACCCSHSGQIG